MTGPISRRMFLALGASVVVAACNDTNASTDSAPASTDSLPPPSSTMPVPKSSITREPFTLGVASGDPTATSVILWTRLAPDPANGGGLDAADVDLLWEVARDPDFTEILASGLVTAEARYGHTVHVDATFAAPDGRGYFRFRTGEWTSPIGSTRLAPAPGSNDPLRIATASCQNWTDGYYAAYADMVDQKPDLVLFLGDYIYEGGPGSLENGDVRLHDSEEPDTLVGYRNRYALYRSDPLLQAAHLTCPWIVIWDDHEVENNYAGTTAQIGPDGEPVDPAVFTARRAAAYQAWWEHMPVRLPAPTDENLTIYRRFAWGDLVNLVALDGRQYRNDQACGDVVLQVTPACPEASDPARSMLGDEQEQWAIDALADSPAVWNVLANQTVMTDIRLGEAIINYDQWDGYAPGRDRLLTGLTERGVANLIVLTGDIHLAGVGNLTVTGEPDTVRGIEFVTTSISSGSNTPDGAEDLFIALPTIVDAELAHRGYTMHTLSAEDWTADYRIVDDARVESSAVRTWKRFLVTAGTPTVVEL
ncbi:MAG: alkaline phosphatase D family protein [Ilumatobacteraceae bacterium]